MNEKADAGPRIKRKSAKVWKRESDDV